MAEARLRTDWDQLSGLYPRYLDGDGAAARLLFSGLLPALTGYFRARMGRSPDVDDLVQGTLLKIHFARDRFDRALSLKTWVFTIASRALIDHWRGAATEAAAFEPTGQGGEPDNDDGRGGLGSLDLAQAEGPSPELKIQLQTDLNAALATLKPIDRSIVYLSGVEGLSMAEIAAVHVLTEGAAKVRAHRAYQQVKKLLVALAILILIRHWTGQV